MFKNVLNNIGTLVVVGKWNVHVFVPDWVKSNIFEGEDMQISVALPTGPYQFKGKKFEITVSEGRLQFELFSADESAQIEAILALRTILRLLNQTPVTAFGINFNYLTDAGLCDFFKDLKGYVDLGDELGLKREVKWSIVDDKNKKSTNIRLVEEKDGMYTFDVNYNYLVGDCKSILSLIGDDEVVSKKKAECEKMLSDMFNLIIDA